MLKTKLVSISGSAFSGKDTLYLILEKIFKEHNIITDRIGLGDFVKSEIMEHCKKSYGLSSFTKDSKEKSILRLLMVAHGKIRRILSNGKCYTELATPRLLDNIKENTLSIVTDCRYMYYPEDEIYWVKSYNGTIIYIERINQDGSAIPPANQDEKENNEKIKEIADYKLVWPTTENEQIRIDYVRIQLKDLIEKIINNN